MKAETGCDQRRRDGAARCGQRAGCEGDYPYVWGWHRPADSTDAGAPPRSEGVNLRRPDARWGAVTAAGVIVAGVGSRGVGEFRIRGHQKFAVGLGVRAVSCDLFPGAVILEGKVDRNPSNEANISSG